jgi:hypothetical protein
MNPLLTMNPWAPCRRAGDAPADGCAPPIRSSAPPHHHADSGSFQCTVSQSRSQAAAFIEAKRKNWRFTACPEAAWLHLLPTVWTPHQLTLVDIGCNKVRLAPAVALSDSPRGVHAYVQWRTMAPWVGSCTLTGRGPSQGYTSARLFGTFASHLNVNSKSLFPHLRCVQVNSRTHVPQKPTGSVSLFKLSIKASIPLSRRVAGFV